MSNLFLCGAGNSEGVRLAIRVNEASRRWDKILLLDDDESKHGTSLLGVAVVGGFELLEHASPDDEVQNLVTRTAVRRRDARRRIESYMSSFATLISPSVDTLGATLDVDLTVYPGATLGPETVLDAGSVIWMGAVVGHESRVGPGSIVASNAVLNARVVLGEGVYVGTNATILPEVNVGAWATVAAGSVVVADVPAGATAVGVPAEIVDWTGRSNGSQTVGQAEAQVVALFREILGKPDLGAEDDFFASGGSSLQAMRLKLAIEKTVNLRLPLIQVMKNPTPRAMAAYVDSLMAAVE